MQMQVVAIYAGINILLLLILGARTARNRQKHKVVLGDGGNAEMARAIRVHGNAAEYIPAALAGLAILALNADATPMWLIHAGGGVLTAGRLLHAAGLARSELNFGRVAGMMLTMLAYVIIGAGLLWVGFAPR